MSALGEGRWLDEYRYIRANLKIPSTAFLELFEEYCTEALHGTDRMEWSWRVCGDAFSAGSFIHCSRPAPPKVIIRDLRLLLDRVEIPVSTLDVPGEWWRILASGKPERLYVGYAGVNAGSRGSEALGVCCGLRSVNREILAEMVKGGFLQPKDLMPPGNPGVLVALDIDVARQARPRVYVFYDAEDYENGSVEAYMSHYVGKRSAGILKGYARSGISFRRNGRAKVHVTLEEKNTWMRLLVAHIASQHPLAARYVDRLTWASTPSDYAFSGVPPDLHVYVRLGVD